MNTDWILYGAYGYTGKALAREAAKRGLRPLLAGRRPEPLQELAEELALDWRSFPCWEAAAIAGEIEPARAVVHCAGPFSETAESMRAACMQTGTHYLDITGEIDVLCRSLELAEQAQKAGIVCMSGTGFDVIPSDCLAALLVRELPGACKLELAFAAGGSASAGTLKTTVNGIPQGGWVRQDGALCRVPVLHRSLEVPFADKTRRAGAIPWGDVGSAWYSTHIPDIEVFLAMTPMQIRLTRWSRPLHRSLAWAPLRRRVHAWIARRVQGPSEAQRLAGRSQLWGRVTAPEGNSISAVLTCPEGYRMTVLGTLELLERVLADRIPPGSWTPSQACGPDFILEFPDTRWELRP